MTWRFTPCDRWSALAVGERLSDFSRTTCRVSRATLDARRCPAALHDLFIVSGRFVNRQRTFCPASVDVLSISGGRSVRCLRMPRQLAADDLSRAGRRFVHHRGTRPQEPADTATVDLMAAVMFLTAVTFPAASTSMCVDATWRT